MPIVTRLGSIPLSIYMYNDGSINRWENHPLSGYPRCQSVYRGSHSWAYNQIEGVELEKKYSFAGA
jgi:hypothetical protein